MSVTDISRTRAPLPVPPLGSKLTDAGDAYVESLSVELRFDINSGGHDCWTMNGAVFEELMSALRLRHLAFNPRTRALVSGKMRSAGFSAALDRHYSSVEPLICEERMSITMYEEIEQIARQADSVRWSQAN